MGSLGTLLSSKLTQTLYDKSLVSFVRWLRTENFAGPDSIDFLSQRFGEFVMSCWEDRHESPPKQLDLTHPAGRAKPARNRWKSNPLVARPAGGFPLTEGVILAMAGLAVYWNWLDVAAALLTDFSVLHRLQELLDISMQI